MTLPCSHLDEFFDGELASADAAAFRTHLATCDRCQRMLSGRMQEAMVVDEAAPVADVLPIARARKRGNTRVIAIAGSVVALAAAVALVWALRGTSKPPQLALAFTIERSPTRVRDSSPTTAHVGDTVHIETAGTLWVYRNDHELVLACPGGRGCRAGGADVTVSALGAYSLVVLSGEHIPPPTGDLDTDVAAALHGHAQSKIQALEVN